MQHETVEQLEIVIEAEQIVEIDASELDLREDMSFFNLGPIRFVAELWRVLKPGGHFSISDVVLRGEIPARLKESAEMYAGCVAGALPESEYLGIIHDLGFESVTIQKRKPIIVPDDILEKYISTEEIAAYKASGAGTFSITVSASKSGAVKEAREVKEAKADCCVPNAEGTAKVKVATGEEGGCDPKSGCG